VIIVVEGPSASGKTTYASTHGGNALVPESSGVVPPVDVSAEERAEFWSHENARRWALAVKAEDSLGRALCDTDPLKLHYDYCLHAIGMLDHAAVLAGVDACRRAIQAHRLGIADLILCSIPDTQTLALQQQRDTTRSRSNFRVNARLGESLRRWYEALAAADPARVQWGFPDVVPQARPRDRYDLGLFDVWMAGLGLRATDS